MSKINYAVFSKDCFDSYVATKVVSALLAKKIISSAEDDKNIVVARYGVNKASLKKILNNVYK